MSASIKKLSSLFYITWIIVRISCEFFKLCALMHRSIALANQKQTAMLQEVFVTCYIQILVQVSAHVVLFAEIDMNFVNDLLCIESNLYPRQKKNTNLA